EVTLDFPGKGLLFCGVVRHSYTFQVGLHAVGQGAIWQQVVDTGVDQSHHPRLSGKGRALGDLLDPGGRSLNVRPVDVAHKQPDPGVVGHDIGSLSALLEDVVDARGRLDVFAHEIDAVGSECSRV